MEEIPRLAACKTLASKRQVHRAPGRDSCHLLAHVAAQDCGHNGARPPLPQLRRYRPQPIMDALRPRPVIEIQQIGVGCPPPGALVNMRFNSCSNNPPGHWQWPRPPAGVFWDIKGSNRPTLSRLNTISQSSRFNTEPRACAPAKTSRHSACAWLYAQAHCAAKK